MDSVHQLFEVTATDQAAMWLLWAGSGVLTVALLVLMVTRWGRSRLLRKCVVLSLFAHVLMAGYAARLPLAAPPRLAPRDPAMEVRIDELLIGPETTAETAPVVPADQKPWESFINQPTLEPTPLEVARAESTELPEPERLTATEPASLPGAPSLDPLPFADPTQPHPQSLPTDELVQTPTANNSPEPLEAPSAERRDGSRMDLPVDSPLQREVYVDSAYSQPARQVNTGLPSALLEQPVAVPRIRDIAGSPGPADSLTGLEDVLTTPSHGKPADWSTEQPPQSGSPVSRMVGPDPSDLVGNLRSPTGAFGAVGAAGTDGLEPIRDATSSIGPPRMPTRQRGDNDHQLPSVYQLRVAPEKSKVAESRGANPETERAVQAALKWLAENQNRDGRWSADRHGAGRENHVQGRDRQSAGMHADTAMTGFALLAFLASGNTHLEGPYRDNVRRGLQFLLNEQGADGNLGGQSTWYAFTYSHGIAAFAMSEAYGMTGDERLRRAVERAVAYTLANQNSRTGGWRYSRGDDGDTSQLGWQLMVLKSAELAGIPMPAKARNGALRFLDSVASGDYRGLASYRPGERASRPMTAEALASRQFLGLDPSSSLAREAGDYLMGELPGEGLDNYYYWYYGTLAMYQLQDEHWQRWNAALQKTLLLSQRSSGSLAGSWDPTDVWGGYGGRVYSTAVATLCLEVYYRFLPLYMQSTSRTPTPRR